MKQNRHACRIDRRRGFTFVELLVAVAIVAILSALALPSYNLLRQRFYDATALADVVNARKAMETLAQGPSFATLVVGPTRIANLPGVQVSKGTRLLVFRIVTGPNRAIYQISGTHPQGSGASYYVVNGRLYALGATL